MVSSACSILVLQYVYFECSIVSGLVCIEPKEPLNCRRRDCENVLANDQSKVSDDFQWDSKSN